MFTGATLPQGGKQNQLGGDPEWWRGGVIYQIYPRSFLDMSGDGIGDLAGIAARLDYIARLGVDAIWISPFFVSPMLDFGYDIADYKNVDPIFGAIEDFDALLNAAHERGLRVLLDLVLSHTSDRHPWFQESRVDRVNAKSDWYVWADPKPDGTPPNNWLSMFGGPAWEWDSRRRQYYLHNFLSSQPDLNFHNPAVQDAVLDVVRFWLERGVDGFRFDTVNMYVHDAELRDNPALPEGLAVNTVPDQNPYGMQQPLYNHTRPENLAFLEKLRTLMDMYPATASMGEIGAVTDMYSTVAEYTCANKRLNTAYSFDFLSDEFSAARVRQLVERMEASRGDAWASWAFSNHDVTRVISRWGMTGVANRAGPLLIALLTSLRGTPCIYQGEELALSEAYVPFEMLQDPYGIRFWPEFKGRDGCRTPMPWSDRAAHGGFSDAHPWLPTAPEHAEHAVSVQETDPLSPLNRVRAFLDWRKTQPEIVKGAIEFVDAPDHVLAFIRTLGDARTLCIFNCSEPAAAMDIARLGPVTPYVQNGFGGALHGNGVALKGFDAFFAAL